MRRTRSLCSRYAERSKWGLGEPGKAQLGGAELSVHRRWVPYVGTGTAAERLESQLP